MMNRDFINDTEVERKIEMKQKALRKLVLSQEKN
jgi:hypothetical protein